MQSKKTLLFSLILLGLLFPASSRINGQLVCLPGQPHQDSPYWRASLVFAGVVDRFVADKTSVSPGGYFVTDSYTSVSNLVRFTIEKPYRGDLKEQIEIASSFNFKEGERYFVYASLGDDGIIYQLDNGFCGKPPLLLKDARDDMDYAEGIASGKIGTRIFGSVVEDRWHLGELRQAFRSRTLKSQ
ncbi:MAG: hypothetical protein ABI999_13625 [Acidobacteriota bacterium]